MSAKCPNCTESLLSVKTYSVDIESSGVLQSGTVYACPACSAAITISLGAPPIVAATVLESVTDVSVNPEDAHPRLSQ